MTINAQNKLKSFYNKAEIYFKTSKLYVLEVEPEDENGAKKELESKGYFVSSIKELNSFTLRISLAHIKHIENSNQYDKNGCFIRGTGEVCPSCGTEWEDHLAVAVCPCLDR